MQIKMILATVVAAIPFIYTQATPITPEQASRIISELLAYESSLQAQPAFTSVASVLATGLPTSVIQRFRNDSSGFVDMYATAAAVPALVTALPSDVQSYFSSVEAARNSIVDQAWSANAAPTGRMAKFMGSVAAAGVVGLALL